MGILGIPCVGRVIEGRDSEKYTLFINGHNPFSNTNRAAVALSPNGDCYTCVYRAIVQLTVPFCVWFVANCIYP